MPDHPCRSQTEEEVCSLLSKMGFNHSHGQLIFPITIHGEGYSYIPDFILHGATLDDKIAIVETIEAEHPDHGEIQKVTAFHEQHGKEYAVILVAKEEVIHQIPKTAYHYIVPIEDLNQFVQILNTMEKRIPEEEEAI